jgi:4-hydroxythreonine-4-phosphate dehydrogenase
LLGRTLPYRVVADASEAARYPTRVCLLDLHNADPDQIPLGQVSAAAGRAAADYIETAVQLAKDGIARGIVTAPINKEALRLAGLPYPGHTEMLAALCGVASVSMLLVHGTMRIAHVTTHVSVREACERITSARVLAVIRLAEGALRQMGLPQRRIAVGGLNPHAGEAGLFGEEEIREIAPAIMQARAEGLDVTGPLPPDTVFARQRAGEFEAVVAMLHDHGHIAVKTVGFTRDRAGRMQTSGVNVTLGLPIIRTSVDHGTAFDIAGQGVADASSMAEAILLAAQMAGRQGKSQE